MPTVTPSTAGGAAAAPAPRGTSSGAVTVRGTASAADSAYAHVKARVLSGDLDGQLVSEGAISDELHLSRTPVREAFLRLQAEGLMRLYPKRGALVVPVAPHEAREVLEARLLVESHALDRAVATASHTGLVARLTELVSRQRQASAATDFAALDAEFHAELVAAGGNGLLTGFYGSLRDRQQRMAAHVLDVTATGDELADQHAAIVGAIAQGDADTARQLLRTHLRGTYAREADA